MKAPTPFSNSIAQKCVDLRRNCVEFEHILELTKRAPRIIDEINRGRPLSEEDMHAAKRVSVPFDQYGRPDAEILQAFIENKSENREEFKKVKSELDRLIKGDFQDSSDVTSDSEPFDPFDPDS